VKIKAIPTAQGLSLTVMKTADGIVPVLVFVQIQRQPL